MSQETVVCFTQYVFKPMQFLQVNLVDFFVIVISWFHRFVVGNFGPKPPERIMLNLFRTKIYLTHYSKNLKNLNSGKTRIYYIFILFFKLNSGNLKRRFRIKSNIIIVYKWEKTTRKYISGTFEFPKSKYNFILFSLGLFRMA